MADLAVHPMTLGVVGLHRQEGPRAHVQGEVMPADTGCVDGGQELGREVQPGRGRCHGAGIAGVDRLVIAGIAGIGRPLAGDVRGQGQFTERRDTLVEDGPGHVEAQDDLAGLALLDHARPQKTRFAGNAVRCVAEGDDIAGGQALGRAGEGPPSVRRLAQVQHDLRPLPRCPGPGPDAAESRGNDAGIVEDEGVPAPQKPGEIANHAVGRLRARCDDEQA